MTIDQPTNRSSRRVLVCASEFPYPVRGGGQADIWRRIEALVQLGHPVMLLNLYDPRGPFVPSPEALAHIDQVLQERYSFAIKRDRWRTLRQLLNMYRVPWHVATRIPESEERKAIIAAVHEFRPDLIWLDGPWFGELALEFRRDLGIPIAYRSHNVEHIYLRRQAAASTRLRNRIAWRLASIGMKRYQLRLMTASSSVFDISINDMQVWRNLGVRSIRWLPPLPETTAIARPRDIVPSDVLFIGGLRTPNNVQGVRWLVNNVLPQLLRSNPHVLVTIVGSHPSPDLRAELANIPAVRVFYDVPDVTPYRYGARVLVNPVSVGSGVQLKMLDMLMTDLPIITRRQGVSGLPPECVHQVTVADSVADFAAAILRCLADPHVDAASRAAARRPFTIQALQEALTTV